MATITTKTKRNSKSKYYHYSRSYRVKRDPATSGKTRGSGKSRVITEEIFLGTVEDVLRKFRENQEPRTAISKPFGLECAPLAAAQDLDFRREMTRR